MISLHDETYIADWVVKSAIVGWPVKPKKLLSAVKLILDRQGSTTPFKDNRPTTSWVRGFRLRHNIADQIPEAIDKGKASVMEADLAKWFENLKSFLR